MSGPWDFKERALVGFSIVVMLMAPTVPDVGCSKLVISCRVKVEHKVEVIELKPESVVFTDGSEVPVDAVIFAHVHRSGFDSINNDIVKIFGKATIDRNGQIGGTDEEDVLKICVGSYPTVISYELRQGPNLALRKSQGSVGEERNTRSVQETIMVPEYGLKGHGLLFNTASDLVRGVVIDNPINPFIQGVVNGRCFLSISLGTECGRE
ncbi:hypothetical protein P691DRAFT_791991 [Macrolepiota fuliginosa MF-IS2]|uniref:Uncharacterized protein n=1 Tax=Macrolepiota fuliginosa MF-IS2 TaxID=1400762 RepID=A0A9P5XD60_9AGAR|nr:hypothetical protein P691DRAFT_791991 [Macrolepiota fuliginosa MF-IS2]